MYNSSPSTLEVLSPSELSDLFKGAHTHKVILEAGTTVLELAERIQCAPRGGKIGEAIPPPSPSSLHNLLTRMAFKEVSSHNDFLEAQT